MAFTVKHSKVSLIPDGDDSSVVRPSDWNADHVIEGYPSASIGTIPPTSPTEGELWWNDEEGKLKIYYNDGTSSQWVDASVGTVGPQGATGATGPAGPNTVTTSTTTNITGLIAGNGTVITAPTPTYVTTALGYTPPNETNPVLFNALEFYGAGVTGYTPFAQTMANWVVDDNNYYLFYLQNLNNGSDASADFVVYNDASDVDSYFIDMGINSSNYSSATYPIFTPNSSYLFSGGGTGAITSDMFIGTSTPSSDVVFFAGGVATTDEVMRIKANNNVIIGTDPDTGETFQVSGSAHIKGATEFSSTVLLSTNPVTALQAATKQYVDNAVSSGIHIHAPVYAETSAALSAVYTQGGTTFNITDITGGNTVVTSTVHGLSVNDEIWLTTTAGNGLSINTPYFVYATPTTTSLQLSASYSGTLLTGLTNATGLSYAVRANSGVGSYLESSANATFTIGSYTLTVGDRILVYQQATGYWDGVYTITSLGSGSTKWKLTRAADQNKYTPQDTNGMGEGDYFLVTTNSESYVMTTPGALIIGYTPITYTLFSAAPIYTGGTNITVAGGVISVSGTIDATLGGTGTSTVTTGDLLYGSGTNTWAKLPAGAGYKSLVMNAGGTNVEWNAVSLNQTNAVSGQLGISNGGTGASTAPAALTALGAYPDTNPNGYTSNTGTVTSVAALTLGTTGIDLSSTVATGTTTPVITLNVPTASATNRGVLSTSDWSTFNQKQDLLVSTSNIKSINGASILGSGDLTVTGTFTGGTLTSNLTVAAGTTSLVPLDFQTGSLLTTATAGGVEYDGKLWYFTPSSTVRALTPSYYYYRKNTATTLASATGNQSIFTLTSGATVQASTIYEIECEFELTTTGTTSHTEAFGFTLATATVTNMGVAVNRLSGNTTSTALGTYLTSVTPVVVTGALTTAQTVIYKVKGTIAFNAGGSINPVIAFSAAPGGTSTIVLGSWMKLTPIGTTGSNVSIGTWA